MWILPARAASRRPFRPTAAYRLLHWPDLGGAWRTAGVLRGLSRMSIGPVTPDWFARTTGLSLARTQRLLDDLVALGSVRRIDLVPAAPAVEETEEEPSSWWQRLARAH